MKWTTGQNWVGSLDEIRISNVARSASWILQQYSRGIGRLAGLYTSSSIEVTSGSTLDSVTWTPVGQATGDGETPYSTTGLVAKWDFNAASGTTADNEGSCGATCDGTLTGFSSTGSRDAAAGTGWTADNKRWGEGALMFDGAGDYVSVGDVSQLELSNVTLATWVKPKVQSTYARIAGKYVYASSVGYHLNIGGAAGGIPYFHVGNGSSTATANSDNVKIYDNKWHYIVGSSPLAFDE